MTQIDFLFLMLQGMLHAILTALLETACKPAGMYTVTVHTVSFALYVSLTELHLLEF